MSLRYLFLFSIIVLSSYCFSQEPVIEWQNTIGGTSSDRLRSIYPTSDGGCILGGHSISNASGDKSENSLGDEDYWVVKLDDQGSIEWENTIGGDWRDELRNIKPTIDGGYIMLGRSASHASGDKSEDPIGNFGTYDYWVIKLNATGNITWENTIGGSIDDVGYDIITLSDGSFIIGGTSSSSISGDKTENSNGGDDYWILKLDSTGNILWQNTIGGSGQELFKKMDLTNDGGFILGGYSNSNISGDKTENSKGGNDYWIVKINSNGIVLWDKTIGGDNEDTLSSIENTSDGGFILSGSSRSSISGDKDEDEIGQGDFWVVKTDNLGDIEWQNTIGGTSIEFDPYVVQAPDNGYLGICWSNSNISGDKDENSVGGFDVWIIKLNTDGTIHWQETIGGSNGESTFRMDYHSNSNSFFLGCSSLSGISGEKTEANIGSNDYWIMKLNDVTLNINNLESNINFSLLPNPTDNILEISTNQEHINQITIYNINGKLINNYKGLDSNKVNINVSKFNLGTYLVKIESQNKTITKKFIKK